MDTRTQTGADDGQRVFLYNLIGRPVGKDVRHVLTFDWQRDSQLDGHIHQHSHNRKNVMLIASNFIHYLHVFTRNGTEKILLFILKPLLILLGVRLVANRCQTFGLGVVVVEAHVQLLVKFIDEVLHGLEAHHLREVLQLWELFAAERRQRNGFVRPADRLLLHLEGPQILEFFVQAHQRGLHTDALLITHSRGGCGCNNP